MNVLYHNNSSRRGTSFWKAETFCECRAIVEDIKCIQNVNVLHQVVENTFNINTNVFHDSEELSQKVLAREDLR